MFLIFMGLSQQKANFFWMPLVHILVEISKRRSESGGEMFS